MRTFRSLLTGLGIAGLLVGTLNLAGCGATMPTATAGSQGDIATASDESEVRKRARIRMELAATYFSQGQFTTALDELKQAEAIDPSLPDTYEMRALIYDAMGDTALPAGYRWARVGAGSDGSAWADAMATGYDIPVGLARLFCLTFEVDFFRSRGFDEIEGSPVDHAVFEQLLQSYDEGVAEFLDLERVKPNTLGNHRMLMLLR